MSAAEKMLLHLLEDGSDMQLVFDSTAGNTEPEILPGHTQILRLWSQVMRTAISAEGSTSGAKIWVPLPGTRKEDWLLAMSFLYPVTPAPVITWHNLEPLLSTADKYCMSALTQQSVTFLCQNKGRLNLLPDSKLFVWKWICLADRYNQVDLAKQIINAATDINGLVQTNPMRQSPTYKGHKLSADTLQHLLSVIPAKAILLQPGIPYCPKCKAHSRIGVATGGRYGHKNLPVYTTHLVHEALQNSELAGFLWHYHVESDAGLYFRNASYGMVPARRSDTFCFINVFTSMLMLTQTIH